MGRKPKRIAVMPDPGDEGQPRPPTRHGWALPAALVAGLAAGVVAILFIVNAARDDTPAAPTVAPIDDQAQAAEPEPTLKVVFPEGFTSEEMAERVTAVNKIAREKRGIEPSLSAQEYRRAAANTNLIPDGFLKRREKPDRLDGFLFPATYDFTQSTTSRELVEQQVEQFEIAWDQIDLTFAEKKNLTSYDVLIIASMIEEEVRVPKERELVAAVIYNRLEAGMPLGIDSTVRYGLGVPATEPLLQSHLDSNDPYNSRKRTGLPPTPITNPGLASMEAAARPAKKKFRYFARTKDCKTHFFTKSEAKFLEFLAGPNSFRAGPSECG